MDAGGGRGLMALWYLTRGTGAVALVLLTASVVLGIANAQRVSSPRFQRFVVDGTHRTVSLLVLALLVVHIATTLIDGYAPVGIADVVIPFGGAYRPLWLGFGALALDLLLAVTITSLLRARLGLRAWRAVHWLAYACWPVALVHGLGTGSDVRAGWLIWLSLGCTVAVVAAVLVRLTDPAASAGVRAGAVGAMLALTVGMAVWLPSGPLAEGWAARAGTPAGLLGGHRASSATDTRTTP